MQLIILLNYSSKIKHTITGKLAAKNIKLKLLFKFKLFK